MEDLFGPSEPRSIDLNGVKIHQGFIARSLQENIVADLRSVANTAPFRRYVTPGGRRMSVAMTAAGSLGWMTDETGYHYAETHHNGQPWPDIPEALLDIWKQVSGVDRAPDSCLVNFYGEGARMGMHQDKDETETKWPVVSISLGDDALFRIGTCKKPSPSKSIWLSSGDVAVLAGEARLVFHGIDRIKFRTSSLLPDAGRLNVTLRVAG